MIRAIFLDVDGTLISFSTHEIPASARRALTQAHERGVRLFIATGRAANDLGPLEGIPYDGVVSLNGARCVANDGRVVSLHPIPRPISNALWRSPRSRTLQWGWNWRRAFSSIA